jgi:hypothetical protein
MCPQQKTIEERSKVPSPIGKVMMRAKAMQLFAIPISAHRFTFYFEHHSQPKLFFKIY